MEHIHSTYEHESELWLEAQHENPGTRKRATQNHISRSDSCKMWFLPFFFHKRFPLMQKWPSRSGEAHTITTLIYSYLNRFEFQFDLEFGFGFGFGWVWKPSLTQFILCNLGSKSCLVCFTWVCCCYCCVMADVSCGSVLNLITCMSFWNSQTKCLVKCLNWNFLLFDLFRF